MASTLAPVSAFVMLHSRCTLAKLAVSALVLSSALAIVLVKLDASALAPVAASALCINSAPALVIAQLVLVHFSAKLVRINVAAWSGLHNIAILLNLVAQYGSA